MGKARDEVSVSFWLRPIFVQVNWFHNSRVPGFADCWYRLWRGLCDVCHKFVFAWITMFGGVMIFVEDFRP